MNNTITQTELEAAQARLKEDIKKIFDIEIIQKDEKIKEREDTIIYMETEELPHMHDAIYEMQQEIAELQKNNNFSHVNKTLIAINGTLLKINDSLKNFHADYVLKNFN